MPAMEASRRRRGGDGEAPDRVGGGAADQFAGGEARDVHPQGVYVLFYIYLHLIYSIISLSHFVTHDITRFIQYSDITRPRDQLRVFARWRSAAWNRL